MLTEGAAYEVLILFSPFLCPPLKQDAAANLGCELEKVLRIVMVTSSGNSQEMKAFFSYECVMELNCIRICCFKGGSRDLADQVGVDRKDKAIYYMLVH